MVCPLPGDGGDSGDGVSPAWWCLLSIVQVLSVGSSALYSHMLYTVNTARPVLASQSGIPRQETGACPPHMWTLEHLIESPPQHPSSLDKVIFGYFCEYLRRMGLETGSAQNNLESDIITGVWHQQLFSDCFHIKLYNCVWERCEGGAGCVVMRRGIGLELSEISQDIVTSLGLHSWAGACPR